MRYKLGFIGFRLFKIDFIYLFKFKVINNNKRIIY